MKQPKTPCLATWFNHPDSCSQHGYACTHKKHADGCRNFAVRVVFTHPGQELWDDLVLRYGKPVIITDSDEIASAIKP